MRASTESEHMMGVIAGADEGLASYHIN
jgi:hypothetical protein